MGKIKFLIKITLSSLLLYFVFSQIDTNQLILIVTDSNIFYLFLAYILFNISKILSAFRLNYFFKEIGIYLKESTNLKLYYLGMFYNLFLPSGIGGDGYKGFLLYKKFKVSIKNIAKALLFDRITGLIALISLLSTLYPFSSLSINSLSYITPIFGVAIFIGLYLITQRFNLFKRYFFKTSILAIAVQLSQLISALFIIKGLNVGSEVDIVDFLIIFLISSIVGVLPLTVGGVGAREFTFFYGFKYFGYNSDIGVAFSLIFFILTAISSLIGVLYINCNLKEEETTS